MAKASKTAAAPVSTLANDKAIIARDFATFGHCVANNDARNAMLRRVTDKDTFKAIRLESMAAWLAHKGSYKTAELALAMLKKTAPRFGKVEQQRTADEQAEYNQASNAWNYYLRVNKIETLNKRATKSTRSPKMAGEKASPAQEPVKSNAPVTLQSVVVTKSPDISDALAQFHLGAAYFGRVANVNAKVLQGDKGAALRALASHVMTEMKRIEALKG